MKKKKILRVVMWLALAGFSGFGALLGFVFYVNWSADRDAREFCGMIPMGSNISAATAKAAEKKISWGPGSEYDFYFFYFFPFERSVCEVSVSKAGEVLSRTVEVEID